MSKENVADLANLDNGIVEVMRAILLVGTSKIEKKVLLDNGFTFSGLDNRLALKQMFEYSICYKQVKQEDYFNFMNMYRGGTK